MGRGGARERVKFCPQRACDIRNAAELQTAVQSPQAETELSGLCDDDMQEQGVSKILTINLNDMAKELKIK